MENRNLSVNFANIRRANRIYDELLRKCHVGRDVRSADIQPILNNESDYRCLTLIFMNLRNAESGMGFNEELHRPDIDFTCRNIDVAKMSCLRRIVAIDKSPFEKTKLLLAVDHDNDVIEGIFEYVSEIHGKKSYDYIQSYVAKQYLDR